MDQALLLLLDKKEFDYITVKELCIKAGVNRSTFYLHYQTMTDLLSESIEYLYKKLRDKFGAEHNLTKEVIARSPTEDLMLFVPKFSIPYLEFIKENKNVFMTAVAKPEIFGTDRSFKALYENIFVPILNRYPIPEKEKKYYVKFYMSGIHSIILEWLKGGCKDEIAFVADMILKCVNVRQGV